MLLVVIISCVGGVQVTTPATATFHVLNGTGNATVAVKEAIMRCALASSLQDSVFAASRIKAVIALQMDPMVSLTSQHVTLQVQAQADSAVVLPPCARGVSEADRLVASAGALSDELESLTISVPDLPDALVRAWPLHMLRAVCPVVLLRGAVFLLGGPLCCGDLDDARMLRTMLCVRALVCVRGQRHLSMSITMPPSAGAVLPQALLPTDHLSSRAARQEPRVHIGRAGTSLRASAFRTEHCVRCSTERTATGWLV